VNASKKFCYKIITCKRAPVFLTYDYITVLDNFYMRKEKTGLSLQTLQNEYLMLYNNSRPKTRRKEKYTVTVPSVTLPEKKNIITPVTHGLRVFA
jgi:hypothetical protein